MFHCCMSRQVLDYLEKKAMIHAIARKCSLACSYQTKQSRGWYHARCIRTGVGA